jgi:hypothetical protein
MAGKTKRKIKRPTKRTTVMAQASDYRKRAEECAEIAQIARTPAQRIMLRHIADTWLRLADDAETNAATKLAAVDVTEPKRLRRSPPAM